jgi:hypothetical protein
MPRNVHHGSATILQFPSRVRSLVGGNREDASAATNIASLRLANTSFGDAWYHEEAVREAEPPRKN